MKLLTIILIFSSFSFAQCAGIDPKASLPLLQSQIPTPANYIVKSSTIHSNGECHIHASEGGYLLPDPSCTPGAINPTVTQELIQSGKFRTGCLRNRLTTEGMKAKTYRWYSITHPKQNSGKSQSCELDHLVPLELGGADSLDNIWPQCGPSRVNLDSRFFRKKDLVENYLARQVKQGKINLADAQRTISSDWTQYLKDVQ